MNELPRVAIKRPQLERLPNELSLADGLTGIVDRCLRVDRSMMTMPYLSALLRVEACAASAVAEIKCSGLLSRTWKVEPSRLVLPLSLSLQVRVGMKELRNLTQNQMQTLVIVRQQLVSLVS